MKKNCLNSLLTLTAALLLVFTSSCNNNNNKNRENDNPSLLSVIQSIDYRVEFEYDSLNRLIKVIEKDLEQTNSIITTDIVYDQLGRITETIYSSRDKNLTDTITDSYSYKGDTIFVRSGSDIDIDTLIVIKDELKYRKSKHYVTEYSYDADANLVQSDERNRNMTFNSKNIYSYKGSEKGLLYAANTPDWFTVYFTALDINYTKKLCSGYINYSIRIEDGMEMKPLNTINHDLVYEFKNGRPSKMTNKNLTYNETSEYSLEYKTK